MHRQKCVCTNDVFLDCYFYIALFAGKLFFPGLYTLKAKIRNDIRHKTSDEEAFVQSAVGGF